MKIYDVCNDYSLELNEGNTVIPTLYRKVPTKFYGEKVEAWYHKEYDELHYIVTESDVDFNGKYFYDFLMN